jgi:hypothetical protein
MADPTLVEPKIKAGAELLQALDRALGDVFAAFWYRDPDSGDWRLVIGSDAVDRLGPNAANRRLIDALPQFRADRSTRTAAVPEISLLELELVGRRDPLVEMLKSVPGTGRLTVDVPRHIYRTMLGNHYVDEAYIYRTLPNGSPTDDRSAPRR